MSCNAVVGLAVLITITTVYGSVTLSRTPKIDGRIVGGEKTSIESFPYQVSVRVFGFHICGGTIIGKRVIITAAHCIYPYIPVKGYSIQYGTSVIGGNKNSINAERLVPNEDYSLASFNNDIALIFLDSDIPLSAVARPIQLASAVPQTGKFGVISGWGSLMEGGKRAAVLHQVSVQIMDLSICQEQYIDLNQVTEKMLCAGVFGGGKDSCKDDSGGPLVIDRRLVGIISFGLGCGRLDYPGVYTNVAAMRDWIDSHLAI